MGTRSTIALEFADGTVQQVYCHWDGYLDHNGVILQKHYSDPFKLRELIDLGDLSSLSENIGTQHGFNDRVNGECTFYGRDRGETGVSAKKFKDFEDYKKNHQYEEYEYILRACGDKAVWFVADHSSTYVPLLAAMANQAVEETEDTD